MCKYHRIAIHHSLLNVDFSNNISNTISLCLINSHPSHTEHIVHSFSFGLILTLYILSGTFPALLLSIFLTTSYFHLIYQLPLHTSCQYIFWFSSCYNQALDTDFNARDISAQCNSTNFVLFTACLKITFFTKIKYFFQYEKQRDWSPSSTKYQV